LLGGKRGREDGERQSELHDSSGLVSMTGVHGGS
jgi:hypothetical protein